MNDRYHPAATQNGNTASDGTERRKQALVLYSDSCGLYLGRCVDIRFWTMLDLFSLHSACTFDDEAAAREEIAAWKAAPPDDIRLVPVMEDESGFASISACIVAGLPARNPGKCLHASQPT